MAFHWVTAYVTQKATVIELNEHLESEFTINISMGILAKLNYNKFNHMPYYCYLFCLFYFLLFKDFKQLLVNNQSRGIVMII